MSFPRSIAAFLTNYLNFGGRASRSEFWWAAAFVGGAFLAAISVDEATGRNGLLPLVFLALLLPGVGVQVRRLHDIGRRGWWVVIEFFLPMSILFLGAAAAVAGLGARRGQDSTTADTFVNLVSIPVFLSAAGCLLLLVWFCMPGTRGPNRFGPDPLAKPDLPDTP